MAKCQRCNKFMLSASKSGYCRDCEVLNAQEKIAKEAKEVEEERLRIVEEARKVEEEKRHLQEERSRIVEKAKWVEEESSRIMEERRKLVEEKQRLSDEQQRIAKEKEALKAEKQQRIAADREAALQFIKNADYSKALPLLQASADAGDAIALNELGECSFYGRGVQKDYDRAFECFRRSAELGNADGQNNLGACYHWGYGTDADPEAALRWIQKAVDQGNAAAMTSLGGLYKEGCAVRQSDKTAFEWFKRAAELGDMHGQYNTGTYLFLGRNIDRDASAAAKWLRLAAEQGHPNAAFNLGVQYMLGDGVTKDIEESVKWLRIAQKKGHPQAGRMLEKAEAELRTAPLKTAERVLVSSFETRLAGVTYRNEGANTENRQQIIRDLLGKGLLRPGQELELRPEPSNRADPQAVAVYAPDGRQLGFLPKDKAHEIFAKLSASGGYSCIVTGVNGGGIGISYGVSVRIEEYRTKTAALPTVRIPANTMYPHVLTLKQMFADFFPKFQATVRRDEDAWKVMSRVTDLNHVCGKTDDPVNLKRAGDYVGACTLYFDWILYRKAVTLGWAAGIFKTLAVAGDIADAVRFGIEWCQHYEQSSDENINLHLNNVLALLCGTQEMTFPEYLKQISGNPNYTIDMEKTDLYTDEYLKGLKQHLLAQRS